MITEELHRRQQVRITSALRLRQNKDVSATTAGGGTEFYQVAFTNDSWSQANLSMVYGPSVNEAPSPSPSPTPEPTPVPEPSPIPSTDPTPADTAPLATDVQTSDDDGDGLKEVITAADGELIDGNRDGIADAEQSDVVGLRMINEGAVSTDYGALETDLAISFSSISFLNPSEPATGTTGTGSKPETYAVTRSDGQTQNTTIPSGINKRQRQRWVGFACTFFAAGTAAQKTEEDGHHPHVYFSSKTS